MFISYCNFWLCNFVPWLWVLAQWMLGGFLAPICILGWLAKTIRHRNDWEPYKYIRLNSNISVFSTQLPLCCIPNMPTATPTLSDGGSVSEEKLEWKETVVSTNWWWSFPYCCKFFKNMGLCEHAAGILSETLWGGMQMRALKLKFL